MQCIYHKECDGNTSCKRTLNIPDIREYSILYSHSSLIQLPVEAVDNLTIKIISISSLVVQESLSSWSSPGSRKTSLNRRICLLNRKLCQQSLISRDLNVTILFPDQWRWRYETVLIQYYFNNNNMRTKNVCRRLTCLLKQIIWNAMTIAIVVRYRYCCRSIFIHLA